MRIVFLTERSSRDVAEYWVVDVHARTVTVHRRPTAAGYDEVSVVPREASIAPLAFPNCEFSLAALLG